MPDQEMLDICKVGIAEWQKAFNSQNAKGCSEQYLENTVMEARPFGTFTGRKAIEEFWQGIMDQGFKDVDYTDVHWEPEKDNDGYILTAKWTMNKAYGVVHREHWIIDTDGKARLKSDDFEVQGER
ncbi:nuclear transport factor 2 family protein [uncultured Endozoicomonas sp.]|uniref:nuclear transport factor 2 family protein n=1 Tax=uncultured Endozoicomonas sp. TaxID=432652 RepID=UPI0026095EFC|nr:nuclear transport factor 2 family protein [uncultured Endozoicomonas sp.]